MNYQQLSLVIDKLESISNELFEALKMNDGQDKNTKVWSAGNDLNEVIETLINHQKTNEEES